MQIILDCLYGRRDIKENAVKEDSCGFLSCGEIYVVNDINTVLKNVDSVSNVWDLFLSRNERRCSVYPNHG